MALAGQGITRGGVVRMVGTPRGGTTTSTARSCTTSQPGDSTPMRRRASSPGTRGSPSRSGSICISATRTRTTVWGARSTSMVGPRRTHGATRRRTTSPRSRARATGHSSHRGSSRTCSFAGGQRTSGTARATPTCQSQRRTCSRTKPRRVDGT